MQIKPSLKSLAIILSAAGIACASIIFLGFRASGQNSDAALTPQNMIESASISPAFSVPIKEQSKSGLPIRLMIPSIKVDAAVEYTGVTPQGAMAVPKGPANAAWFNLGPRPGEIGSAVIAGHFGWKNKIPAVFDNVSKLKKGDKLYVKDVTGTTVVFTVRALKLFGENDDASAVFGSSDGKAHLNLITCEGTWNAARKSYSNRLVVFTDKE